MNHRRTIVIHAAPLAASVLLHGVVYGALALVPPPSVPPRPGLRADLVIVEPVMAERPAPPAAPQRVHRRSLPRSIEPATRVAPGEAAVPEPPAPSAAPAAIPAPPAAAPAEAPSPVVASSPARSEPSLATDVPASAAVEAVPSDLDVAAAAAPWPGTLDRRAPSMLDGAPGRLAALPPATPGTLSGPPIPRGGYQVKPSYPASARRAGVEGTTLLGVRVEADGRVGDVVVKQSAGHPDLDRAAEDAVRRWRFEPAGRAGEAVAVWVELPVQFHLR